MNTYHRQVRGKFEDGDACIFVHYDAAVLKSESILTLENLSYRFGSKGYCFQLHRYTVESVLEQLRANTAINRFALYNFKRRLHKIHNGPHWYSHETDLMRLVVLAQFGGWYLDTDVIVLQTLSGLTDVIGRQSDDELNGSVMHFHCDNPFVYWVLNSFLLFYNPDQWAANGPILLTSAVKHISKCMEKHGKLCRVHVLPATAFQSVHYNKMIYAIMGPRLIFNSSNFAFHYNNKLAGSSVEKWFSTRGTLAHQLLTEYCVLCDNHTWGLGYGSPTTVQ